MNDQPPTDAEPTAFVSRGGFKLHHALRQFTVDPAGWWCADLGCSTGGFTDCLLKAGAARVYAVDTGYGVLDYTLRIDPRISVHERTNALHATPPQDVMDRGGVDLVTIDMSWTVQEKCLPAAAAWLAPAGRVITLIKPHYEATGGPFREQFASAVVDGVLGREIGLETLQRTLEDLPRLGFEVIAWTPSPILGGKPKKRKPRHRNTDHAETPGSGSGNIEYLALLRTRPE